MRHPEPFRDDQRAAVMPGFATVGALAITVYVLSAGREVLVPLALALLLTVAVIPIVAWLQRRGTPRVAAVLVVLALVVAMLGGLGFTLVNEALKLAEQLPQYEQVIRGKLAVVAEGSGVFDQLAAMATRLGAAMSGPETSAAAPTVAVVAERGGGPFTTILGLFHLVLAPLALLAITLLLMAFLLMQREDMRDRVLRLVGTRDLHRTTEAMGDATARVGRYLLMQLCVNGLFGLCMGTGMWLLGLPNAPLWGLLCFTLRFVPYLGALLSLVFPLVIAFATTEGWGTVLLVVGLFVVVDVVITYVLEPTLYGHSTGITPFALLLSSTFWTLIWGPVGLILAPAITACIVILGRHVPALEFLAVLLGDEAPLPPPARFYQRFLARDDEAAEALLSQAVAEGGVAAAMSGIVLPALARLEEDQRTGAVPTGFALRAGRRIGQLAAAELGQDGAAPDALLLPVAGPLDQAAALALAAALDDEGHAVAIGGEVGGRRAKVVVLVSVAAPSQGRLRRAAALASRLGERVMVFDGSAAGRAGLLSPVLDGRAPERTLEQVLARVQEAAPAQREGHAAA